MNRNLLNFRLRPHCLASAVLALVLPMLAGAAPASHAARKAPVRAASHAKPAAKAAAVRGRAPAKAPARGVVTAASAAAKPIRPLAEILRDAPATEWRTPEADNVLRMKLETGTVWIELAPRFAPRHAANIRTLVDQRYFDGLSVLRVQDNFVSQWGDPDAESPDKARSLGAAAAKLPPEFSVADAGMRIDRLTDRDAFAPVTGFVDGFPVGNDPRTRRAWIAHCYGVVGAGRSDTVDSGNGAELYAVIGQAPRALDQNITVVGRVLQGMELLSALPRGTGPMGFYDKPSQFLRIESVQKLSDLPAEERPRIQVMKTDNADWREIVESRRNRPDAWYVHKAGATDLCNLTVPVRIDPPASATAPVPASGASR